jgi:hypothetical protein
MNNGDFIERVLQPLVEFYSPGGRKTHERRFMVHFDNAEEVREHLARFGFKRMEQ